MRSVRVAAHNYYHRLTTGSLTNLRDLEGGVFLSLLLSFLIPPVTSGQPLVCHEYIIIITGVWANNTGQTTRYGPIIQGYGPIIQDNHHTCS